MADLRENKMTWHHVALSVPDMEKALAFYRDLLGFEVDWDMDHRNEEKLAAVVGLPGADAHMAMLKGYGTRIELFRYYHPEGRSTEPRRQCDFGITHFTFAVSDIHALYDRYREGGAEFVSEPQNLREGVWAVYMKDPFGNTIELVQYE